MPVLVYMEMVRVMEAILDANQEATAAVIICVNIENHVISWSGVGLRGSAAGWKPLERTFPQVKYI